MLSPDDQERFSRQLLLDRLGGLGQECLCAASVLIDLPHASSAAARSCARALSAAGLGTLILRGPWAPTLAAECRELSASLDCRVLAEGASELPANPDVKVYFVHEAPDIDPSSDRTSSSSLPLTICLPAAPRSPADAAALGALAALEALKLIAGVGTPAAQPLAPFPATRPASHSSSAPEARR